MPKYALIQNTGGLTCLLCHLLHFRRFSGHFVEPVLCCISSNITLLGPTKHTKVGCCDAGRTWARPKFQQNSPIKYCWTLLKPWLYISMFIQSSQLVKSFPSLFLEEFEQLNVNKSTFSALVSGSAVEPNC
jgi:hypothetical protein